MLVGLSKSSVDLSRVHRIGAHSHIRGLGDVGGFNEHQGMIGQEKARRAASVVTEMVREGKIAGRVVLFSGQPGSGKTALALAMARALGDDVPFTHMSASEIFSLDMSKSEVLTQGLRKSIGVQIKESSEVFEGEIAELSIEKPSGVNQTKRGSMTLKTTDMESLYVLGPKLIDALEKQGITAGDVVSVDRGSGRISRLGRSLLRSSDFDAVPSSTKFVKCPEGEIRKTRELVHTVTLHEIDVINSRAQGFLALFAGDTGEIKSEIREQIDTRVAEWRSEGKASIVPGVLFIDECHILDLECFAFLNKALENENAPILVMATNKGITKIRGTDILSPHGIPMDFLDRMLIIPTLPYTSDEVSDIIKQREKEEDLAINPDAHQLITVIGTKTSLRYALHLLSLAAIAARKRKEKELITVPDVERVYKLFMDVERSSEYLEACQNQFLYDQRESKIVKDQGDEPM